MSTSFSAEDAQWMRRALILAARGYTTPNPMVGCVIVRDGAKISEGYHRIVGAPHAEADAIAKAGEPLYGATAYVTLEPCVHFGRTPPCSRGIIDSGSKRVVAAVEDPDDRVAGKGIEELRAAGIRVDVGLMDREARDLNDAYFHHRISGRPFVILKAAMSLDGKIATRTGDSKWISSQESRRFAHKLRGRAGAVLCGIGTVLKDDPLLTFRMRGAPRQPLRIVLDSTLRIPTASNLVETAGDVETLIVTSSSPDKNKADRLRWLGVEILPISTDNEGHICLNSLLEVLGERGVASVLVEGGGEVHASFIANRLAHKLVWFVAPKLIGGRKAPTPIEGMGVSAIAESIIISAMKVRRLGGDILAEGRIEY